MRKELIIRWIRGFCGAAAGVGLCAGAAQVDGEKRGDLVDRGALFAQEGKSVSETMRVRGVGVSGDGAWIELYSAEKWDHPECVFFRIPTAITNRVARWGAVDLNSVFSGRRVTVEGTVTLLTFGDSPRDLRPIPCVVVDAVENVSIRPVEYVQREVHGFTLQLDPRDAVVRRREVDAVIAEIRRQLHAVSDMVPARHLPALRSIPITVVDLPIRSSAVFDWRDPGKTGSTFIGPSRGVVIGNWYEFLAEAKTHQPLILLHELGHAYHHGVLGGDAHEGIRQAYEAAMKKGLYAKVRRLGAADQEAYATTDAREYFCEITEAWFGWNDFFPFDHEELQRHDPEGARLMQTVWGTPRIRWKEWKEKHDAAIP